MIEYKVIKEIDRNSEHTQRSLAEQLDVSLGKINYLISAFVKIGVIQAKKMRNHHDKIRWRYYLTPKGIQEKIRLTKVYYDALSKEYSEVKKDLEAIKA
jgi:EPS-associated MarR family transcriptional regulator